ncbi:MAG: hypothetical protein ACKOBN_03535 [Flavobacteriales bacterium]
MKKLYTLLFLLISTSFYYAQKVNYESSKWFWGFNIGSTWSSTDLKDDNYNGFGLTLGRSYNYDYGRALSFDIRGRFLAGQWYGQGTDYTTLGSNVNPALQSYLVGDQNYVHNFRTDARELDLELVLHAGKLRERTGFDPYIFGGLGLTWQQNWTDALDTSGLIYDYNAMAAAGPLASQLPGVLDNIYETRLDGIANNGWQVNWMPSLGFGLAYHRGRFSIGLEHKTTFTMSDSFDGLQDQTARLKNDWYHYTSAIVQIHFKQRNPQTRPVGENPRPNPVPNTAPNNQSNTNPCPTPEVQTFFPPQNAVTSSTIKIEFTVAFINGAQDLVLLNSFNQSIPFNYNSFSSRVEALVNLNPGINNFTLRATTPCGTDQQTIQINRENCQKPAIQIVNNTVNNTVTQAAYNFTATITGQVNSNQIQLIHNGMSVLGFNFNSTNGQLQRQINLSPGSNIIRVEANNACGNAAEQISINLNSCERPALTLLNPSAAGTTTNSSTLALKVQITGTVLGGQAQVYHNNNLLSNVQVSGNYITANLILTPGSNTIQVRFSNQCGMDQLNTTINYQNCVAPVITILSPVMNSTVQSSALRLRAKLANVSNRALIKLLVNGNEVTSFTFNNIDGLLEYSGQLNVGINNFTLTAANDCGTDIETFTINFDACKKPTLAFNSSMPANNSTVSNAALNLLAQSTFLNQNQITLTFNGVSSQPFTFQNGNIAASLNLKPGLNTILLQGKNDCDRTSLSLNINYVPAAPPCDPPQVIYNMVPTGSTVNNPVFTYYATVVNYTSTSNIILSINGTVLSGYSNVNGSLAAELGLIEGNNQISITVTNECGTFTNTYYVTYVNDGTEGGQRKPGTTPTKPVSPQPKPSTTPVKPATTPAKPASPQPKPATTPVKPATTPVKPTTTPVKPSAPKTGAGTQKPDTLKTPPIPVKSPEKPNEIKTEKGGGR